MRDSQPATASAPSVSLSSKQAPHPHAAQLTASCGRMCLRVLENRRANARIEVSASSLPMTSVTNRMDNTEIPVASAALILAIWIALAGAVIVLLNLAKWTVCNSKRLNRAAAGTALAWPTAEPASKIEPTATSSRSQSPSGVARVDFEPSTPR